MFTHLVRFGEVNFSASLYVCMCIYQKEKEREGNIFSKIQSLILWIVKQLYVNAAKRIPDLSTYTYFMLIIDYTKKILILRNISFFLYIENTPYQYCNCLVWQQLLNLHNIESINIFLKFNGYIKMLNAVF